MHRLLRGDVAERHRVASLFATQLVRMVPFAAAEFSVFPLCEQECRLVVTFRDLRWDRSTDALLVRVCDRMFDRATALSHDAGVPT